MVVPDCEGQDRHHDPPGRVPAAFTYTYLSVHCLEPCPPQHRMTLCAQCCARILDMARNPHPGVWAPSPPVSIQVVRDANTGAPVIPAATFPPGPRLPRFFLSADPALSLPHTRVQVLLDWREQH